MSELRNDPQQYRSRETYKRLIDATRVVVARDGWQRATTAAIAEESRVSIGTVYRYYPTIHEWRAAAGFGVATHGIERVLELHAPDGDPINVSASDGQPAVTYQPNCRHDGAEYPCPTIRALQEES